MASCSWCAGTPVLNLGAKHASHPLCQDCLGQVGQNCPSCETPFTAEEKTRIESFLRPTPQSPSLQHPPGLPPQLQGASPPQHGYALPPQPGFPRSSSFPEAISPLFPGTIRPSMPPGYQSPTTPPPQVPSSVSMGSLGRPSICSICRKQTVDAVKLQCGHYFCRVELKENLTKQAGVSKEVKCPVDHCGNIVTAYSLMMLLDKEAFQQYRLTHLATIIVTCPACSVIEQIGKKHRDVICSNCELTYCSRCTKAKTDCHCLVPAEMTCPKCSLVIRPDRSRHRQIICQNCDAAICTYCIQSPPTCSCNHNALTAVTRLDDVVVCSICGDYIQMDDLNSIIAMEECTHVYHKECIQNYVEAELQGRQVSKAIGCPTRGCSGVVGNFQSLVRPELWDMFNQSLIQASFKIVQCPNPSCLESCSVDGEMRDITCPSCRKAFCMNCKEPPHRGSCSQDFILRRIREMEAMGPVAQCPGCKLPYNKDEGCNHVTCLNPSCRAVFQFCCSCLREPIMAHCNAWHRPDCQAYNAVGAETEKFSPAKCSECKRLGRLCDKPKQLRVPCRLDEDER